MTNCIKLRNQTQVNWHWWSGPLQEFKRTISTPMPTNLSVCMTPSLVVLAPFHTLISNSIPHPHLLLNRWTNRAGKHFSPGLRLDHSKRTLKTFSIYWQIDTKETFSAPNCSANENCSKKKNNQKKKATKRERRVVVSDRWRLWKQNGIGAVPTAKTENDASLKTKQDCLLMCAYAVFSTKMERTTKTSSATIPKIQSYSRRNSLQFPIPPAWRGGDRSGASLQTWDV